MIRTPKDRQQKTAKRKRSARKNRSLSHAALRGCDGFREIVSRANEYGISVDVKATAGRARRPDALHVMFGRNGLRIADYWPSTGTLLIGGSRSHAENIATALERVREAIDTNSTGNGELKTAGPAAKKIGCN